MIRSLLVAVLALIASGALAQSDPVTISGNGPFSLIIGTAQAQVTCVPNPNIGPWTGAPSFVNGCPPTATGLNSLAPLNSPNFTGTANFTGANFTGAANFVAGSFIGAQNAAITADGAIATAQSNSTSAFSIYNPTGAGPYYDSMRGVLNNPLGSTTQNSNAVGAYVTNNAVTSPTNGNAVGVFSFGVSAGTNSATWGANNLMVTTSGKTGEQIFGTENDFVAKNTSDKVVGYSAAGSSTAQPTSAVAFTVNNLSTQSPGTAFWNYGYVCADGTVGANVCQYTGAQAASGSNVASSFNQLAYRDGAGTFRTYNFSIDASGNYNIQDSAGSSAGHSMKPSTGLAFVMAASFFPATATVAGLPTCNSGTKGAVWVVTDQSGTPTYGGVLTGGGSNTWEVLCTGSSWAAH